MGVTLTRVSCSHALEVAGNETTSVTACESAEDCEEEDDECFDTRTQKCPTEANGDEKSATGANCVRHEVRRPIGGMCVLGILRGRGAVR